MINHKYIFSLILMFLLYNNSSGQNTVEDFIIIENIKLEGNHKTKSSIITRELDISVGDTILIGQKDSLLQINQNKVFNLNLFIKVSLRTETTKDHFSNLIISVHEQWYIFPAPLFDLADRNLNEWKNQYNADLKRINYGLQVTHNNLTGNRDKLKFLIQFGFTRKYNLSYSLPYIDKSQKSGIGIYTTFAESNSLAYAIEGNKLVSLSENKNLIRRFKASLAFSYRKSFFSSHLLELKFKNTRVADTISKLNYNYFKNGNKNQNFFEFTYAFKKDLRDIHVYPLEGSFLKASINKKGLGIFTDLNMLSIRWDYAIYKKIYKTLFVENKIAGTLNLFSNIPFSQNEAMGYGDNFLRGYELYVINGQHFVLQKNTLKQRLFRKEKNFKCIPIRQFRLIPIDLYLTLYFDMGYSKNGSNTGLENLLDNRFLYSGGCGLDLVTFYSTVFKFNYSINLLGERNFFLNINTSF